LKEELLVNCDSSRKRQVLDDLKELKKFSSTLAGDELADNFIEDAAVFVFEVFDSTKQIGEKEARRIRDAFGPYPASVASKAFSVVQRLKKACGDKSFFDESQTAAKVRKKFGSEIPFSFHGEIQCVISRPCKSGDADDYDSISEDEADLMQHMMQLTDDIMSKRSNGEIPTNDIQKGKTPTDPNTTGYDGKWLQNVCHICCGEARTWKELYTLVFDTLSLSVESERIQEELMDLLGLDHFDLVLKMLEHRESIVASILENPALLVQEGTELPSDGSRQSSRKPRHGCQITVQSEQERVLKKQMRKEEKRLAKKGKDVLLSQTYSSEIDVDVLRMIREQELQEAALRPLLTGRHASSINPSELYPYVYDALAAVLHSAAVVAGSKISLPATAIKKDTHSYTEVRLPAETSHAPMPNIGIEKIQVSNLDEMARSAFQGTKSLNLIQSVVYEQAYRTNENLLICAPTGAGKTNIAMLTVLRELKLHLTAQGTIKKNEFKIIYVAPMKALAAEMVSNFGKRLAPLGIAVRELTGDMQMTKSEVQSTQMIVTTPEKWDVVTRKGTGDVSLSQIVRLLIIDEVHLLHEDRGAVIETLVARTLRQVESTQNMIRIIGLSATLPNYLDVARFLRVNPYKGLFFFDGRFRPVPLTQAFIGVKSPKPLQQMKEMDEVCFDSVLESAQKGHQVLVFVHARNATVKTATILRDMAAAENKLEFFQPEQTGELGTAVTQVKKSRNKELRDLFTDGFSIHHAGMHRQDRNLVERLFSRGMIKVLVCTATLAWGVNLPAVKVIIKGTQIYDAQKSSFVDLGILDVLQIFGRAGRPQYHSEGEGIIITTHDKLPHYLSLMTRQNPIESQFPASLTDNLNAEVALGTVTNVDEAVQWLSYTYLYVRMRQSPQTYGVPFVTLETDPTLEEHRRKLIVTSASELDKAQMIRFVAHTQPQGLFPTDVGRIASHFYIKYASVEVFNENFKPTMSEDGILSMVSNSQEFEQLKVRDDEVAELVSLMHSCPVPVKGGAENAHGKVNILLQSYISKEFVEAFSLVSDMAYTAQNAGRILRGLFEMSLRKGWPTMAARLLTVCKSTDLRLWPFEHPLWQFKDIPFEIMDKIEKSNIGLYHLRDMKADEIGHLIRHPKMGKDIKKMVDCFPVINLEASIQPITRTVLRVRLTVTPEFNWNSRFHGNIAEGWWIWVEDPEHDHLYHSEFFQLQKKYVISGTPQELVFTIPIFESLPPQYYVRAMSDRWLGAEAVAAISFQHLILPELHPPHTNLLNLQPLPLSCLKPPHYQSMYKFDYFNPVQTQIFHTMYYTDHNVLLGAPTGSGKTVAAELAMFRVFENYPGAKCVYVAPLKALVRERIEDWKVRIEQNLGKRVVELTGDVTPDVRAIERADVIVTTPEKWDGISRSWQTRSYVQAVSLIVIDEIHMLGEERGPVLEVIVSRTNFISSHTEHKVRIVGLSTALANAKDLADWLGIKPAGLFNFRPAVRPVPLDVHISGFAAKQYCPRMATMNKPAYTAISTYSPTKPILIFVASRRQTRLTAQALIGFLATTETPKQWLHMPENELESLLSGVKDTNLVFTLGFGIGMHHAGLQEHDRRTVEELFLNQKIQVLVATATLAWGVNLPAHLVIVKGTEYFDGKTQHYVDYPITDVLQMMGRAGRPQFDDQGVAVIFVQDTKKHYYKKFLYEPFPVESSLLEVLSDHLNAETVAGTISSKQEAVDYMTWTYFFRRLIRNPSYYHLEDTTSGSINTYLSQLVERSLTELEISSCIEIDEIDNRTITPLPLGSIASFYYLHHLTVRLFRSRISPSNTMEELLKILSDVPEYDELPVRHNEDNLNSSLAKQLPIEVDASSYDSPHTKAHLLLQAHFSRAPLPIVDYSTDTKSVLDQAIRILQAMIDVAANEGWLATTLHAAQLLQMVVQGSWASESSLLTLPHLLDDHIHLLSRAFARWNKTRKCGVAGVTCLPELLHVISRDDRFLDLALKQVLNSSQLKDVKGAILGLPVVTVKWQLQCHSDSQGRPPAATQGVKKYTQLYSDEEYSLRIELTRTTLRGAKLAKEAKAVAPRFPKPKDEGWFVILGEIDTGELVALKRIGGIRSKSTLTLSFTAPHSGCHIYTLYLISDSYLGLDQQYPLPLEIVEHNYDQ
jgi:activating signal cointegrator complex subunit 3